MNIKLSILVFCSGLALMACDKINNNTQASNVSVASKPAASVEIPQQAETISELNSKDGKINIKAKGAFTDISQNANERPAGVQPDQILLLQRSDEDGVVIDVEDFGKAKYGAQQYFTKLKKSLEADKSLQKLEIDEPNGKQMSYRFIQNDVNGDLALNESCTVILENEQIYSVCVNSPEMPPEDLKEVLAEINVKH